MKEPLHPDHWGNDARLNELSLLLEKRWGFKYSCVVLRGKDVPGAYDDKCYQASHNSLRADLEVLISRRLSDELRNLDPVCRGVVLPPSIIADIAFSMLENCLECGKKPSKELRLLLADLLGVTRHRRAYAAEWDGPKRKFLLATYRDAHAELRGKRKLSVHKLAKRVSAGVSTISDWRREPRYREEVKQRKELLELQGKPLLLPASVRRGKRPLEAVITFGIPHDKERP
jgi:hypothetical protein